MAWNNVKDYSFYLALLFDKKGEKSKMSITVKSMKTEIIFEEEDLSFKYVKEAIL